MNLRSLLPRLILSLILICNGIGSAMASAHMAQMEASGTGSAMLQAEETTTMGDDCGHGADASAPPAHSTPQEDDECLQSCLAMCLQHCHTMTGVTVALALADIGAAPVLPETSGVLPSPASPPMRPPIA